MKKIQLKPHITAYEISMEEIGKVDFALCAQPTETLENYYLRQTYKPTILINGGFFHGADGRTIFNYIDERKFISSDENFKFGYALDGNSLVFGHLNEFLHEGIPVVESFVSGYPPLIMDGAKVPLTYASEINYSARRTILARKGTYTYVIIVDSPGERFAGLQDVLYDFNLDSAINLDGGGSTRMLLNGELATEPAWSRPVDNVIAFYLQEPQPTIYRVQVGAFSYKHYADAMRDKVAELSNAYGVNYSSCFVKYVSPYYKVQVGAFHQKEGANLIAADLKSKGIDAFITTN